MIKGLRQFLFTQDKRYLSVKSFLTEKEETNNEEDKKKCSCRYLDLIHQYLAWGAIARHTELLLHRSTR